MEALTEKKSSFARSLRQEGFFDNPYYRRFGFGFVFILLIVLYTVLGWVTPFYIDDWMFKAFWLDNAGSDSFSISGFLNFNKFIRDFDNGRIANLLSPFSTVFSPFKEIFPFFNGCFYALMILAVQRLATGFRSGLNWYMLVLAWACLIFFLPWYDSLLIFDYTLNYVWAGAVSLLFVLFLLKGEYSGWNGWRLLSVLLLALIAGGFHEGFAVSSICGLLLMLLARRGRVSGYFYIVLTVYIVSTLVFMLSEGIIDRIGYTMVDRHFFPSFRIYAVLTVVAASFAFLICFSWGRKIALSVAKSDVFLICLGICVSGYVIGYSTVNSPRSYFYGDEAMVIILLQLVYRTALHFKSFFNRYPWLAAVSASVLVILCTLQTISVIYWQKKYGDETEHVYELIEKADNGLIFYDFVNTGMPPRYTLGMPVSISNIWDFFWEYRALNMFYKRPVMSVVPTGLKSLDMNTKVPVEGSLKAWRVGDYILVPKKDMNFSEPLTFPKLEKMNIILDNNQVIKEATLYPFVVSSSDSILRDTLLYLKPKGYDVASVSEINRK